MDKKIVIITGSPRRRGNCSRLAASFERRLRELGYTVTEFDVCSFSASDWSESTAYFQGGSRDDDCTAFQQLLIREIDEAEGVVLVLPVYIYGMPAQMVAALDVIGSKVRSGEISGRKKCALISCCAQKKLSVFNGIKFTFEHLVKAFGWENSGELLLTGLWKRADADKHHAVDEAYAFADKFVSSPSEEEKKAEEKPEENNKSKANRLVIASVADDILPSWIFSGG